MTAILLIFGSCQYKIYIFSTKEPLRDIIARFFSAATPAAANTQHTAVLTSRFLNRSLLTFLTKFRIKAASNAVTSGFMPRSPCCG